MTLEEALAKRFLTDQAAAEAREDDGRAEEERAFAESLGARFKELHKSTRHGRGLDADS